MASSIVSGIYPHYVVSYRRWVLKRDDFNSRMRHDREVILYRQVNGKFCIRTSEK